MIRFEKSEWLVLAILLLTAFEFASAEPGSAPKTAADTAAKALVTQGVADLFKIDTTTAEELLLRDTARHEIRISPAVTEPEDPTDPPDPTVIGEPVSTRDIGIIKLLAELKPAQYRAALEELNGLLAEMQTDDAAELVVPKSVEELTLELKKSLEGLIAIQEWNRDTPPNAWPSPLATARYRALTTYQTLQAQSEKGIPARDSLLGMTFDKVKNGEINKPGAAKKAATPAPIQKPAVPVKDVAGQHWLETAVQKWDGLIPKPDSLDLKDPNIAPFHYFTFLHEYSLRFGLKDLQRVLESQQMLSEGGLFENPRNAQDAAAFRTPEGLRKVVLTHLIAKPWFKSALPPPRPPNRFEVQSVTKPISFMRVSNAIADSAGKDSLRLFVKAYEQTESLGFSWEARVKYAETIVDSPEIDSNALDRQQDFLATHLAKSATEENFHKLWKASPGLKGLNTQTLDEDRDKFNPGYLAGFVNEIKKKEALKNFEAVAAKVTEALDEIFQNEIFKGPADPANFSDQMAGLLLKAEAIAKLIEPLGKEDRKRLTQRLSQFKALPFPDEMASSTETIVAYGLLQRFIGQPIGQPGGRANAQAAGSKERNAEKREVIVNTALGNKNPLAFTIRLIGFVRLVTSEEGLGITDRISDPVSLHLAALDEGVSFAGQYVQRFKAQESQHKGELGIFIRLLQTDNKIGHGFRVGRTYAEILPAEEKFKAIEIASKPPPPDAKTGETDHPETRARRESAPDERGFSLGHVGLFTGAGVLGTALVYPLYKQIRKASEKRALGRHCGVAAFAGNSGRGGHLGGAHNTKGTADATAPSHQSRGQRNTVSPPRSSLSNHNVNLDDATLPVPLDENGEPSGVGPSRNVITEELDPRTLSSADQKFLDEPDFVGPPINPNDTYKLEVPQ